MRHGSPIAPQKPRLMPSGRRSQNTPRGAGRQPGPVHGSGWLGHITLALLSKGRKDGLGPAKLWVRSRRWDPVWPTSDMSPQGSAWLPPGLQGHCFGGQTRARLLCSGIYPGSRMGFS